VSENIWLIMARLRRAQPRNPDTMAVCEALEEALIATAPPPAEPTTIVSPLPSGKFDRDAYHRDYMREYMRKRRREARV